MPHRKGHLEDRSTQRNRKVCVLLVISSDGGNIPVAEQRPDGVLLFEEC